MISVCPAALPISPEEPNEICLPPTPQIVSALLIRSLGLDTSILILEESTTGLRVEIALISPK